MQEWAGAPARICDRKGVRTTGFRGRGSEPTQGCCLWAGSTHPCLAFWGTWLPFRANFSARKKEPTNKYAMACTALIAHTLGIVVLVLVHSVSISMSRFTKPESSIKNSKNSFKNSQTTTHRLSYTVDIERASLPCHGVIKIRLQWRR